ncbi:MAG: pyridoxamine 5'-phosphate oxidase family protein, partial [bacterium]|nr:pyridoxamine 5'-phosphate oxidase family protein [bacterium]
MNDLKRQIYDLIKRPHLTSLATITEDGKPWVRYMSAVGGEDFTIRMSTFVTSRKVQQIKNDPEVHLTCGCSGLDDFNSYL